MNAMTEQTYRPIILSKYTAVLKSCRNLISSEDIRLIRKAFKIAIQNETEASELNYQEIVRILDITLIITQEIGLGRTSIICAMLHKTVEKEMITLEQIREMFGEKVEQIIKGLKDISHIYATQRIVNSENFRKLLLSFAEDIRVQLIFLAEKLYALRQAAQLSEAGQKQLAMETSYIYIPFGIVQYQIGDGRHSSPLCQSPNLPGDRTKIEGIENRPGGLHCRIYRSDCRRNEPERYQI